MFIKASDPAVRYSGRWHMEESFAVTTTPGAYAEMNERQSPTNGTLP